MRNHVALLSLAVAYCLLVTGASAQFLSIGAKGGVPLNTPYTPNDESRRYLVGPSIEFRLPGNFALEADALYQRTGNRSYAAYILAPDSSTGYSIRSRGNSWQFPVLGKYYFRSDRRTWEPFLATGYAFRSVWAHSTVQSGNPDGSVTQYSADHRNPLDIGVVAAGGMRFRLGRIKVLPEFRYTRWGTSDYTVRKNYVNFLLGVSF